LRPLLERLAAIGVDDDTLGDVAADLGDLAGALQTIEDALNRIASGEDVAGAIEVIDSEVRDHIPGHARSLRRLPMRLRKALDS
jgi:hypothetical protein